MDFHPLVGNLSGDCQLRFAVTKLCLRATYDLEYAFDRFCIFFN